MVQNTQEEFNRKLVDMLGEVTKLLPRNKEEYKVALQKLEEAKFWILRCRK